MTLLLRLGTERVAIPLGAVREIATAVAPTRLPTAPAAVLGLFSLRGELMTLLDLAVLLGFGPQGERASHAVVLETSHGTGALAVPELPQLAELGSQMAPAERPATLGAYSVGASTGDGLDDGAFAVLLDVDALFAPDRIAG